MPHGPFRYKVLSQCFNRLFGNCLEHFTKFLLWKGCGKLRELKLNGEKLAYGYTPKTRNKFRFVWKLRTAGR